MALFIGIFLLLVLPSQSNPFKRKSPGNEFPVPRVANQLMYLQRDPNTNTIIYELNLHDNKLDADNPVHVFWIKFAEKGQKEELTFVQRKFAYGINTKHLSGEEYELRIVSYKKCLLHLMRDKENEFHVYATINNRQAILKRIFIHIKGGSLFFPNVQYIELSGTDAITGAALVQQFKP